MVKKTTRTKKPGSNLGGRPRQDPNTLRTERLVVRVHPDLMAELTRLADINGITRSLLIERSMIALVNQPAPEGQSIIGMAGRYIRGAEKPTEAPLGTPDSFTQLWSRVIGGTPVVPSRLPRPPADGKTPQPPSWVEPDDEDDDPENE
jgi:hypothetical protein